MLTYLEINGGTCTFNSYEDVNEPEEYFTNLNLTYEDTLDLNDQGWDERVPLIEAKITLINIGEMFNQGVFGFDIFDFEGDMCNLYETFISNDEDGGFFLKKHITNDDKDFNGFGDFLYIEKIKKLNGANNFHIMEAVLDMMKRFGFSSGLTVFYGTEEEKEEIEILKQLGFRYADDSNWLFFPNELKLKEEPFKTCISS